MTIGKALDVGLPVGANLSRKCDLRPMPVASLLRRLRNASSEHRVIARGMIAVVVFVMIGKCAGAAKEMAIAYRYGVSVEVDAYVFLFSLVNLPVAIWFGVLSAVLVPLAARIRQSDPDQLPPFRAELLGCALVLGAVLASICYFCLPILVVSDWVRLPTLTASIAAAQAPFLTALVPLGLVSGLLSIWMLSSGRHLNTLLEGVPALVILIVLLLIARPGVETLVWATVGGYLLHLICLAYSLVKRREINIPRFSFLSPQWRPFWHGFGIMLVGQALMSMTNVIDQIFAARLDPGSIASLSYAKRVLALLLGLGALAISRATLPVFSHGMVQPEVKIERIARHWAYGMFVLGLLAFAVAWALSPWVISLLFERGAFGASDTIAVTEIFRYGSMQLPFYFSGIVLVSLLVSQRRYKAITMISIANFVAKILALVILTPVLGTRGVALSDAFMYAVSLTLLILAVTAYRAHRSG